MDLTESIADELALEALKVVGNDVDSRIVENIAEVMGASSQTLQEAFLTAVRVRRAEARARSMLAEATAAKSG